MLLSFLNEHLAVVCRFVSPFFKESNMFKQALLGLIMGVCVAVVAAMPRNASLDQRVKELVGGSSILPDCNHSSSTASTCSGSYVCDTTVFQTPHDGNPLNDCTGNFVLNYCVIMGCQDQNTIAVTNRKCGPNECSPVIPF